MKTEDLTIEVVSPPNSEAGAWEAARDVLADCFLHLLLERVKTEDKHIRNDKKNGSE